MFTDKRTRALELGKKRKRRWESPLAPRVKAQGRPTGSSRHSGEQEQSKAKVKKQVYLDLGQKKFNKSECPSCGMLFAPGVEQDEKAHRVFCKSQSTRFPLAKSMNIVESFSDKKLAVVHVTFQDDPRTLQRIKRFKEDIVDKDMGFVDESHRRFLLQPGASAFLCIQQTDHKPVGFLISERIARAARLDALVEDTSVIRALPTERVEAVLGIRQIWVDSALRRQGIALRLLDAARNCAVYNFHVSKEQLAFSQPTVQGHALAKAYCGRPDILVYELSSTESK